MGILLRVSLPFSLVEDGKIMHEGSQVSNGDRNSPLNA